MKMLNVLKKAIISPIIIGMMLVSMPASAAGKSKSIASFQDWSIFNSNQAGGKICWIATQPTDSKISREGAKRGEIFMMVSMRPAENITNEISFIAGYPLKPATQATLTIGGQSFPMHTDGEGAWPLSTEDDAKIILAMKKGATAIIKGVSSRGTRTTDTFSLKGFTKALGTAQASCN